MTDQMSQYIVLVVLIAFIVICFILFAYYLHKGHKKYKEIIKKQAVKRNGTTTGGILIGNPTLRFDYYSNKVKLHTISSRYSTTTFLEIKLSRPTNQKMKVYKEGYASKVGKLIGMQDIEIRDVYFDDEVILKGTDEAFIRKILTFGIREKLRELIKKHKIYFSLVDDLLIIAFNSYFKTEEDCDEVIDFALRIVDKIRKSEIIKN